MRNIALFSLLLAFASPVHAQLGQSTLASDEELVDRVVAVVGDTVLLLSDVQVELAQLEAAGQLPQDPAQREQAGLQIMQSRISDLIVVVAAREAGITVSDEQVNEQVEQQLQQVQ